MTETLPSNMSNKRARPDSVVEDQDCAPDTPPLPTSSEQSQHELLLQLNTDTAPANSIRLVNDRLPFQELLRTWEHERDNLTICSVRLVGDSRQPLLYTGISAETLATHSAWGAGRLKYEHSSHAIVPVRTPASVVEKVVRALYSGSVEVGQDVEDILVLANALQAPIEQLVRRYVQQPWTEEIMAVLQILFGHLNRHNIFQEHHLASLCRHNTGKLCELQVLDLLLSAGFDQSDHRLASVFQVARVTPIAMQQFSEAAVFGNFHNNLLIAICNRGKRTASWTASFETIRIQMLDVGKSFEHSIDAPEGLKGSIKTLPGLADWVFAPQHSLASRTPLGFKIRQLITYVVRDSFPLIKVLDTINLAPNDTEVRLPRNGKTGSVLQKKPTCVIRGVPATQTCFGVKFIKR